jgi:hypothetical protein
VFLCFCVFILFLFRDCQQCFLAGLSSRDGQTARRRSADISRTIQRTGNHLLLFVFLFFVCLFVCLFLLCFSLGGDVERCVVGDGRAVSVSKGNHNTLDIGVLFDLILNLFDCSMRNEFFVLLSTILVFQKR